MQKPPTTVSLLASSSARADSLEILKRYCEVGLKVIPLWGTKGDRCGCGKVDCSSQGKHPRIAKNWQLLGSSSVRKVTDWYKKYAGCNFGVMTGTPKYSYESEENLTEKQRWLVVVDVDDLNALDLFEQPLTPTFSCDTGRGRHFWYWSKKLYPASKNVLANKVDIKAKGGYVVAPPSLHFSGREYKITPGCEQMLIADMPTWIEDRLEHALKTTAAPKRRSRTTVVVQPSMAGDIGPVKVTGILGVKQLDGLVQKVSIMNVHLLRNWLADGGLIPLGARNTCIHKLLSSDRARGADQQTLEKNASVYANFCVSPETIMQLELQNIVTSVLKYDPCVTTHKKYNEIYVKWLTKTKNINVSTAETTHRTLETIDQLIFYAMRARQKNDYVATADTIHNTLTLANWRLLRDAVYSALAIPFQSRIKDLDEHNLLKEHGLTIRWFGGGYVNRKRIGKKEKYIRANLFEVMKELKTLVDKWLLSGTLPEEVKTAVNEKASNFLTDTRYWKKYASEIGLQPPAPSSNGASLIAGVITLKHNRAPKTFRQPSASVVEQTISPIAMTAKAKRAAAASVPTPTPTPLYMGKKVVDNRPDNVVEYAYLEMLHMKNDVSAPRPEEIKATVKRNQNPNVWKYEVDSSIEELSSKMSYLKKLLEKYGEIPDLEADEKLLQPEMVEDWICDLRKGDVVGIGTKVYKVTEIPDTGPFYATLYPREEKKHRVNDPPATAVPEPITLRQIDSGLAQNRCEILYRDGRPFGFEDYEVSILLPPKKEEA